jgi:hypothetical protein
MLITIEIGSNLFGKVIDNIEMNVDERYARLTEILTVDNLDEMQLLEEEILEEISRKLNINTDSIWTIRQNRTGKYLVEF